MKTVGIIAEYNPFHNGHAWQLAEAKKRTGADFSVIVMSGDFVQRGEPAMTDKFTRTKMALLGGADLVIELPVQYACGSAEYFARGACTLLDRLGVVDILCFGCEDELPDAFSALSGLLADEPPAFSRCLKKYLACGNSFPKARLLALEACLPPSETLPMDSARALLSSPNNTLGLEYLIACRRARTAPLIFCPSSVREPDTTVISHPGILHLQQHCGRIRICWITMCQPAAFLF